jgi:hypothetical protein
MAYLRLALRPGIDKQNTEYGAEGGWIDCDYVRFRYGLPEKIGGWSYFDDTETYFIGQASDVLSWNSLVGVAYTIIGTNRKLYATSSGLYADITPIRATSDPGDVTFSATDGSVEITVIETGHGASLGDFVTFSGTTSLGGNITSTVLDQEYEIQRVIGPNSYVISSPIAADALDIGNGGATSVAQYQISVGSDVSLFDFGWGTGTWNLSTWGTPRPTTGLSLGSRIWKFDTFGEDIICQIVDGSTYIFDTSGGVSSSNRATIVAGAPTKSRFALVSTPDRHLVCFGTETTIGSSATQDPMFVRFSSQEDINTFEESATNTAGGQKLTDGNKIISAVRSRGQILIFTDTSLHGMQYIGPPFTFGFQQLGANCGCIGPHAAVDVNGMAFWMGPEAFYVFDGTVKKMPCTVQDYVFEDFNIVQGEKVFAGVNSQFNEITWWYCSTGANYIDRFVSFNYLEGTWHIGSMPRTAWIDIGTYDKPLASEYLPNNNSTSLTTIQGVTPGRCILYNQEDGLNAIDLPILAYLQSGYFDIGDGDTMVFMKRFIPDFKNQQGNLTVNLLLRPYPQSSATLSSTDPHLITPTTQKVDTRARGRQISLQITSEELDTFWRYGTMRVDIQSDGLR